MGHIILESTYIGRFVLVRVVVLPTSPTSGCGARLACETDFEQLATLSMASSDKLSSNPATRSNGVWEVLEYCAKSEAPAQRIGDAEDAHCNAPSGRRQLAACRTEATLFMEQDAKN